MAHHVEPMDIDSMDSDFDNKENTFHHSNVLPCTEKGYEELDVSELNMKLRYSITPASSPMSKSYTAHYHDNRNSEVSDDSLNTTVTDNLTRSLNSTMTKNDSVIKSLKTLPLQMLPTDQYTDSNRNVSVLRQFDSTITGDDNAKVTVIVSGTNDDENVSLASSSSSSPHTPEATTPIKDIPKDGGSPIMRGLKSVLNMFRSSQSPVPPEADNGNFKHEIHQSEVRSPKYDHEDNASQALIASTPIAAHRNRETVNKRSSPHKDSIVFNDDLEKELQWKDETTILLSQEKVPIQKLHIQQTSLSPDCRSNDLNNTSVREEPVKQDNLNTTVEYMDISYNVSLTDRTMTEIQTNKNDLTTTESDSEFLDCETTFSKNDSQNLDNREIDNVTIPNVDVTQNMTKINSTFDVPANSTETKEEIIMETKEEPLHIPSQSNIITELEEQSNIITELEEPDKSTLSIHLAVTNEDKMHIITNYEVTSSDSKDIEQNEVQYLTYKNEPVFISTMPISSEPILSEAINESLDITITEEITVNNQAEINVSIHNNDHELIKLNSELEPDSLEYNEGKVITNVKAICETNAKPVIAPIIEYPEELQNTVHAFVELSDANATLCDIPKTELPADVPLPEEDDIEKELDMTVDCLDKNIVNLTQDLPKVESTHNSIKLDEKLDKSLMDLLSEKRTENIDNPLLNITTELSNMQNYSYQIDQNMSLDSIQLLNDIKSFVECDSATSAKLVEQIETELNAFQTMDINESVYNINTLSGVVNERILLPCSENLEQNINEIDCIDMTTQSHSSFDNGETNIVSDALTEPNNESVADIMNTTVGITIDEKNLDDVSKVYVVKNDIENTVLPEIDDKDLEIHLSYKDVLIDKITEVIETMSDENVVVPNSIEEDIDESKNKSPILPENDTKEKISAQYNENITGPNSEIIDTFNEERFYVVPNTVTIGENVIIQDKIQVNDIIPNEQCIESITDEEIILSANTSPFVSMSTGIDLIEPNSELHFEGIENSSVPEDKIANAPPTSPAIVSRGYNFNFDEMDDPFATKTTIRMSPPPNTRNKIDLEGENADIIFEPPKRDMNKNRRKSQPERKKPALAKNKFNATFDEAVKVPLKKVDNQEIPPMDIDKSVSKFIDIDSIQCQGVKHSNESITEMGNYELEKPEVKKMDDPKLIDDKLNDIADTIVDKDDNEHKDKTIELNFSQEDKCFTQSKTIVENETKNTSSSEQSTYYSVGTSSNESIPSRNVFNLPEIDDMNFNPFATKTKMRQSPPPVLAMDDPFATKSKMRQSPPSNLETDDPFATKSNMKFTPDSSMINYGNVDDHDANIANTIILNKSETVPSPNDNTYKMETEKMEKETSGNISTCSSKATDDRDSTVIEVHTEDEDTEEGPFLEADDVHNLDKMSDFDGDNVDMMQLNEFPTQSNDDNLTGEMFIDAEAFEFLLNQNKSNVVADSGKESLFLKFDPLFAKRISTDGVLAALSKVQRRQQNTPTKVTKPSQRNITLEKSPTAGPSNLNITYEENSSKINNESSEDLNVTGSKPMMVVTPAINPVVTPRNKSLTPTRSNRHSITFTSPAMAVIDRLLSMSANNSLVSHDTTITHATREQNEADLALTQLRELLAEKEIHVYNLRSESKEMRDRLMSLESQMKTLESESQRRLTNINELNGRLSEKTKVNRSMAAVVEEYERTIASLIAEIEQDKKQHAEEREQLIKERDEQTAHLTSMEVSFSDLHSKYEKSKQIILSCKANEDTYKKSIKACVENFNKMQNNYELLKQHATTKLNHANQEMEKFNRAHEAEVLKLNAMIKRKDLHITSLEETLTQKTKANEELTAICDELINKVG